MLFITLKLSSCHDDALLLYRGRTLLPLKGELVALLVLPATVLHVFSESVRAVFYYALSYLIPS